VHCPLHVRVQAYQMRARRMYRTFVPPLRPKDVEAVQATVASGACTLLFC
jgi:hypothetical protein